jgi:pentatricopeptide repeat protein
VLITCLNKAGEWERSLEWFEEMRQSGVEADALTFTALFSACEKGGEWKRALKVCKFVRQVRHVIILCIKSSTLPGILVQFEGGSQFED